MTRAAALNDPAKTAAAPQSAEFLDIRNLSDRRRQDIRVSAESYYRDQVWNFQKETGANKTFAIGFNRLAMLDGSMLTDPENERYLSLFKELAYTLVTNPPAGRPKLTTIIKFLGHGATLLLRFMHKERIAQFSDITKADMGRFLTWCAELPNQNNPKADISSATLETRACGLYWVHAQRAKMSHGLYVNPWEDITSKQWAANAAESISQGRTREMPDEIARILVLKAMAVIQTAKSYVDAGDAYQAYRACRGRYTPDNPFNWKQFGFDTHFDWTAHPSHVTVAGYILIALFSGMRVNEIVSMQLTYPGQGNSQALPCMFREDVEVDGLVRKCYFVRGYTKKLEKVPRLTQWQVAPIAHEAIEAIATVRAALMNEKQYLFAARTSTSIARYMYENSINDGLQKFVERHDIRWNGELWPLATHQFRKKFARMLVRQGLGLRDIQDQMKHLDIEMTKRYGHMQLYQELQAERFALAKEQYDELLRGSTPIIGGGAEQVEALRAEFIGKTRDSQAEFLEKLSKTALIDAVDFGLCMYNPKRSQCGGNRHNCKPADCLNAVIPLDTALRHLEGRRARNEELLRVVKSPLSRAHILEAQETTIRLLQQAESKAVQITADLKAMAE